MSEIKSDAPITSEDKAVERVLSSGESVLCVNLWNSYCKRCGIDCEPDEKTHETNLGWSEETRKKKGCGAIYKYITSDYLGIDIKENSLKLRPDLEWIQPFDTRLAAMESEPQEETGAQTPPPPNVV